MSAANTGSMENIEPSTSSSLHQTSPNTSTMSSLLSAATAPFAEEPIRVMARRHTISVASGQTAEAASAEAEPMFLVDVVMSGATTGPSLGKCTKLSDSEDVVMVDTGATLVSSPGSQAHASSTEPAPTSDTLMLARTSRSLSNCATPSEGLERDIAAAQVADREHNTWLTPGENEIVVETRNAKGRKTGGVVIFTKLEPSKRTEILQSEDLSRYLVDASPLPEQTEPSQSPSSRDKGKGRMIDKPLTSSSHQSATPTTPRKTVMSDSYAAERISASVERRVAKYAVTHPPGWFDDLPPINKGLFQDSPHKEYKMVLIHTARCNICLRYNKGTLFMCADCTVSICEECADRKSGVGVGDDAIGEEDVEMSEGDTFGKDAGAMTFTTVEGATAGGKIAFVEVGEASDPPERKLNWGGPYHEVFRGAYLEWRAKYRGKDSFVSAEGVEFKPSTYKQGGRKRKAT